MIESTKQTLTEWAFEHGQEAGVANGIAECRAEGELKTRRNAIKEVLTDRFGELPAELVAMIDTTTDVERFRNGLRQVAPNSVTR